MHGSALACLSMIIVKKKNYIKKIYNRKLRQNKRSSVATFFSKPWAVKYVYFNLTIFITLNWIIFSKFQKKRCIQNLKKLYGIFWYNNKWIVVKIGIPCL